MKFLPKAENAKMQKQNQTFIVVAFTRESAIPMERNVKDLVSRQNLIFAKSPFEKITYVNSNNPKMEIRLVIEAPTIVLLNQPKSEHNFPKSDLSKLRIEAPLERKEFLKISEERIENLQSPIIKNSFQKFVEIPKEDWEKRDFIRLENWHLLLNSNSGDISIIGYRSDIEEVNIICIKLFIFYVVMAK